MRRFYERASKDERKSRGPSSSPRSVRLANVDVEAARAFVLDLARALHAQGAAADRLEAMLALVTRRLGIEASIYSTPTAVMVGLGPPGEGTTALLRVEPGATNLEKLAALYATTVQVIHGDIEPKAGAERVRDIVAAPPRFGPAAVLLATGVSSAAAAVFFGGRGREIVASFAVGLAVGTTDYLSGRSSRRLTMVEPVAGLVAALLAALAARVAGPLSPLVVTLAGVVVLLPGLAITTAMTELATRNLASGTARFAGAFVQLLGLGLGVAFGGRLVALLGIAGAAAPTAPWPVPAVVAAVAVSAVAFAVVLQARPRDIGWILLAAALAFGGARVGADVLGAELGAFVGALVLGIGANAFAQVLDRPAAIVLVPGLLVLVPGSIGFRGVFFLLENDVVTGVTAAFTTVLVAIALVAGILVANVALPVRRGL